MGLYQQMNLLRLACLLVVFVLQGCALPGTTRIEDQYRHIAIQLDKSFSMNRRGHTLTWPAGMYRLKYEDNDYVYFIPDAKPGWATGMMPIGLCIKKQNGLPTACLEELDAFLWQTVDKRYLNIPFELDYRYINAESGQPVPEQDLPAWLKPNK